MSIFLQLCELLINIRKYIKKKHTVQNYGLEIEASQ